MVNLDPSNHSNTNTTVGVLKGYEAIYTSKIGLKTSSAEYVASLIVNVNI